MARNPEDRGVAGCFASAARENHGQWFGGGIARACAGKDFSVSDRALGQGDSRICQGPVHSPGIICAQGSGVVDVLVTVFGTKGCIERYEGVG